MASPSLRTNTDGLKMEKRVVRILSFNCVIPAQPVKRKLMTTVVMIGRTDHQPRQGMIMAMDTVRNVRSGKKVNEASRVSQNWPGNLGDL